MRGPVSAPSGPLGRATPALPGLHVRVQLLSRDMAMQKIRAERVADAVLGQAAREAGRAYIFTHRITNLALRHGDDFGRVLGRVMAHEVGHLVLPIDSHADRGIMRANIGMSAEKRLRLHDRARRRHPLDALWPLHAPTQTRSPILVSSIVDELTLNIPPGSLRSAVGVLGRDCR